MDEPLARIVIATATRAARDVGSLAPMLKEKSDPSVYEEVKPGIGVVVYEIYESILEPIFERFPNLKTEFEQNIERYGCGA